MLSSPETIDHVRALLSHPAGRAHMAGICGVGMAGLAVLLARRGLRVSGCDQGADSPMAAWLMERGIAVVAGHDPAHLDPAPELVIYSPALPGDHPELAAARRRGIPLARRGEVLPLLLEGRRSIAVAGTHGKTTTSTFIAQILRGAGQATGFCIGGESAPLGGVADAGDGTGLVVEADESDGTLAGYSPEIAVITNIDRDHLEHFSDEAELGACFRTFARRAGTVVYCADDEPARRWVGDGAGAVAYGCSARAEVRAESIREEAWSVRYDLWVRGQAAGPVVVPVPGRHNVLNSLAAVAALLEWGVELETIRAGLARVELPRRRFERIAARAGWMAISDYAHHPAEVAALVRTARATGSRRVRAVFQPHRYSRTRALGAEFPAAWAAVDELILLPVYAASEPPLEGGSIGDLYDHFRRGGEGTSRPPVWAGDISAVEAYWRRTREAGDLFLVAGAGDVDRLAGRIRSEWGADREANSDWIDALERVPLVHSRLRRREPVGMRTGLGLGGEAEVGVEVGDEADLDQLMGWNRSAKVPCHILGGGSNVWVSDLGVRGFVVRLGDGFRLMRREGGRLVAGSAVPLARLMARASDEGLAGLEFLEGIPGTVGGAIRMNAGAWGETTGERVAWVRVMDSTGAIRILEPRELDFGYRHVRGLPEGVILEAAFELTSAGRESIERNRSEMAGRRRWMQGLRCAGSVFKNPPGDYAGRLIEAAGLKGRRVGGVTIGPQHANVFTVEAGARASDFMAAAEQARTAVAARWGIALELEVVMWE